MRKTKKKIKKIAKSDPPRAKHSDDLSQIVSWARELAEAKTKKEREKVRARIRSFIIE
jgi:hypothetical protein